MVIAVAIGCRPADGGIPSGSPSPTATIVPVIHADTPTPPARYSFPVVEADFESLVAAAGEAPGFLRLLRAIPDTPDARRQVWLNDFRYMWRFLQERGIARPGGDDPPDAVLDALRKLAGGEIYLLPMPESAPWISGGLSSDYVSKYLFHGDSGVDARNVDLAARTGRGQWYQGLSNEVEELEVAFGDYDPARIRAELGSCGDCIPHETRLHRGVEYLAWGEDLQPNLRTRLKPPWMDWVGRGGRVALFDGKIVRALGTPGIEGLIDAHLSLSPSMADDPKTAAAAHALDALGAYTAVISSADFSLDGLQKHLRQRTISRSDGRFGYGFAAEGLGGQVSGSIDGTPGATPVPVSAESVVASAPLLKPFEVAAFGQLPQRSADSREIVVVIVHASEEDAQINQRLLLGRLQDTRFADGIPLYADRIRLVELDVEGGILIARITFDAELGPDFFFSPAALVDLPLTVSR